MLNAIFAIRRKILKFYDVQNVKRPNIYLVLKQVLMQTKSLNFLGNAMIANSVSLVKDLIKKKN